MASVSQESGSSASAGSEAPRPLPPISPAYTRSRPPAPPRTCALPRTWPAGGRGSRLADRDAEDDQRSTHELPERQALADQDRRPDRREHRLERRNERDADRRQDPLRPGLDAEREQRREYRQVQEREPEP